MMLFGQYDLQVGRGCRVVGIIGILASVLFVAHSLLFMPGVPRAQQIRCENNLKQIGLAFKTWAIDNEDRFPFNQSSNAGGTKELCRVNSDGFDTNAAAHFQVMSNELSIPVILVCPRDKGRKAAANFARLRRENVSYKLRSGANIDDNHPEEILAVCPIHGNFLRCDGSVTVVKADPSPFFDWTQLKVSLAYHQDFCAALMRGLALLVASIVVLWLGYRLKSTRPGGGVEATVIIGLALVLIGFLLAAPVPRDQRFGWNPDATPMNVTPAAIFGVSTNDLPPRVLRTQMP